MKVNYDNNAVIIITDELITRYEAKSQNIIRVTSSLDDFKDVSPLEIEKFENLHIQVEEQADCLTLSTERLQLKIDSNALNTQWNSKDGKLFDVPGAQLARTPVIRYSTCGEEPVIRQVKTVDGLRSFVENLRPVEDHMAYKARLYFGWDEDEAIHGLGQGEEGIFNLRGHVQYLYQHNMRIPMPFIISEKGYGILFDSGCLGYFNDDERGSYMYLECVEQLDYYVIYGDTMEEIVAGVRKLTGKASMLPKWAFGYVQSKEKYSSQDELVSVASEYRKRDIPIDCIVQDWKTWTGDNWGQKELDPTRYPDTKAMAADMARLNVHTMVSVWPNMNEGTSNNTEMLEKGYLLNDLSTYDAFNEEARATYFRQAKDGLYDNGFESWWCDSTEPFPGPDWGGEMQREPWERFRLVGQEHEKFLGADRANLYAKYHARGMYENQRAYAPNKRMLNLTRSGYLGIQKYGTMLWSGDISARWDVLRTQIVEGLNMASSSMPYWTLDAGGFFVLHKNWQKRGCECNQDPTMKWFWHGDYEDGIEDMGFRELYTRWLQMATFLPMFRSHGTDAPREIWNFGNEGDLFYDALAKTIRLRYKLMPYIYSLAGNVVVDDELMMKPLYFIARGDKTACSVKDEYMFGDELLICPVTNPMYYDRKSKKLEGVSKTRKCYLPKGNLWYDFEDHKCYEGGQYVEVEADIDKIPVFVRAGSIVPMEEKLDYADQVVSSPLIIKIYKGADGTFKYYEDAADGYDYENGDYNQILMTWSDASQALTIAAADKKFAGGIIGRELLISLGQQTKNVRYEGKEITIKF